MIGASCKLKSRAPGDDHRPRVDLAMATITIRNLDDDVKTWLRKRAARNGRSMEEETRLILHSPD